jgi:hypothetical protein
MFFVKELGNRGLQFDQNLDVAAEHARAMVTRGIGFGCLNGSVLDLLVSEHIQVSVAGEWVALKLALHQNLVVTGVVNRPHKGPIVLEGVFDIMVAILLGLVGLDGNLEDFLLEKDEEVVERTGH